MDGRTNGRTDGWTEGRTDVYLRAYPLGLQLDAHFQLLREKKNIIRLPSNPLPQFCPPLSIVPFLPPPPSTTESGGGGWLKTTGCFALIQFPVASWSTRTFIKHSFKHSHAHTHTRKYINTRNISNTSTYIMDTFITYIHQSREWIEKGWDRKRICNG